MSLNFSAGFHLLKPGMRVSGREISVVFVNTYTSGMYAGKKYINIDLVSDPDLTFVEPGVSGPLETVADPDALYTQLKDAGMTEAFPGFLIDPTNISVIEADASRISFDFTGHQPYIFERSTDPAETERIKIANQTWTIPQTDFDAALTLFLNLDTPGGEQIEEILNNLQVLQDLIDGIEDGFDFTGRITAPATDNVVPFLYPDQAAFPAAADVHGALAHSHADGAFYYAHAGTWHKLANDADLLTTIAALDAEALARTNADTTLQANIDVVSAGLATEIANRTTGDTATLSSANTYTDTAINNLVDGAGPALDTLKELGDALEDNDDEIAALVTSLANETTARTAGDAALSGRLDTLEADPTTQTLLDVETTARITVDNALDGRVSTLEGNAAITDPTTATAVAAVQSDVDQNEADSDAADAALSGRLDVLEADPTTAAAVAAVQADVDQNELDSDAADAALSGRLDTLEADPTTATAVAAVQADVDQNEADGDAADAALSGRLDTLEADPTTATAVAAVQADVDQNEADADAALALRALLDGSNIPGTYNNDTEAAAGGVAVGAIYKNTNGTIHYRVS